MLPDGRRLAYAEWGEPDGKPVFLFHGTPHSRLWCPDEEATSVAGVRLITVDRPGIGGSDVLEARTFGDLPADIVALADALGIGRFAVVGLSAGGLTAAACAALIPSRLTSVEIVSCRGLAEYNFAERPGAYEELDDEERADYDLAQSDPWAAAEQVAERDADWVTGLREQPESLIDLANWPEGDHWFFADQARADDFFAAVRECLRQGMDGFKWEATDTYLPWGFRLDTIAMRVRLWHGEEDPGVSLEQVAFIMDHIPDCALVTWPDVGHMGIAKHWADILAAI
jgi:pimeloyl-ACP methyl ester carboxylesterase